MSRSDQYRHAARQHASCGGSICNDPHYIHACYEGIATELLLTRCSYVWSASRHSHELLARYHFSDGMLLLLLL